MLGHCGLETHVTPHERWDSSHRKRGWIIEVRKLFNETDDSRAAELSLTEQSAEPIQDKQGQSMLVSLWVLAYATPEH